MKIGRENSKMQTQLELAKCINSDIFFRETWHDWVSYFGDDSLFQSQRFSILMMKPDGVVARKTHKTIAFLERNKFSVHNIAKVRLSRSIIRALWRSNWLEYSAERLHFSDYLYGGSDAILMLVHDESDFETSCAERLAPLKGAAELEKREPWHLRRVLGSSNRVINYVHCADDTVEFIQELAILLSRVERLALFERRTPAEIHAAIGRIEEDNPEYHFDFDLAAAGLELSDELIIEIKSGRKMRFDVLLERIDTTSRAVDLSTWDIVAVAIEAIELDHQPLVIRAEPLATDRTSSSLQETLNVPENWAKGVEQSRLDAQVAAVQNKQGLSPYDEPANHFRAARLCDK